MWTCPRCNEPNEDQFTACWKCAPSDEEAVRRAAAPPRPADNRVWPDVFGVQSPIGTAPEEPVQKVDPAGRVRCPT
jgi:hypothetical protein